MQHQEAVTCVGCIMRLANDAQVAVIMSPWHFGGWWSNQTSLVKQNLPKTSTHFAFDSVVGYGLKSGSTVSANRVPGRLQT